MKVLYLSQIDTLQVVEIEVILDRFLRNGSPSALLKRLAEELDAQGFSIGHQAVFGHFTVISLNLPKSNILILSDEELHALYGYAVIGHEGLAEDEITIPAANAWAKIGELTAGITKSKKEEKEDA